MLNNIIGASNLKTSKIILGTWQAGKAMWSGIDDKETSEAIRAALDLGVNMIDTATVYGGGHAENVIAKALKGVSRSTYQLADKVFSDKLKYDDVIAECNKSLQALDTEYLDLYQIHWPSGSFGSKEVPIQETMEALCSLQKAGKILNIGVSNFSKAQIMEAAQYATIVSNQPPYSLLWRQYDNDANQYCREHNISILAYSPLAQGILTGKFKRGHKFADGDHRAGNRLMRPDIFPKVEEVLHGLEQYAEKYNTSIANVALNWLISQPNTFAISGVRNVDQIKDNVKCLDFTLSSQELAEIDHLSLHVTNNMQQTGTMWREE